MPRAAPALEETVGIMDGGPVVGSSVVGDFVGESVVGVAVELFMVGDSVGTSVVVLNSVGKAVAFV